MDGENSSGSPLHQKAAEALQKAVTTAPVLARWERGRGTRIVTDGSKIGIGAILEQLHPQGGYQSAAPRTGSATNVTIADPSAALGGDQTISPRAEDGGMPDRLAVPMSNSQSADPPDREGGPAPC